ncbi:hypothetical protein D3C71_2058780 [compost metagenome]
MIDNLRSYPLCLVIPIQPGQLALSQLTPHRYQRQEGDAKSRHHTLLNRFNAPKFQIGIGKYTVAVQMTLK